jgi:hypothetical protein
MNTLPKYMKGDNGRFDFRVPDGLGHWVYPDWDDPGLKVEFYDADNNLKATATVGGDLALTQGDDYDENNNPDGGKFVAVEGIDLADFALGVAEAWVYAKVSSVQVMPYPTVIAAFEVVASAAEGPLYTTVDRVKAEIPGSWPESVTDEMVMLAVADASRKIDAFLRTCYDTPFPDINDDPETPAVLETICRKLAAYQCLLWMGRVNAAGECNLKQIAMSELMRLAPSQGKTPMVRLPGYRGPVAAYRGDIARSDDQVLEDVLT